MVNHNCHIYAQKSLNAVRHFIIQYKVNFYSHSQRYDYTAP